MRFKFTGVDTFSGANCEVTRTIKEDKRHLFTDSFIKGFLGKTIKQTLDGVRFDILIKTVELIAD